MRTDERIEKFRIWSGKLGSKMGEKHGAFIVEFQSYKLLAISSGEKDKEWEHVSVSLKHRCPNWREMSFIKDLFWDEEDCVVQFHPPKSDHVNNHPYCLHLWKCINAEQPRPHWALVGIKNEVSDEARQSNGRGVRETGQQASG